MTTNIDFPSLILGNINSLVFLKKASDSTFVYVNNTVLKTLKYKNLEEIIGKDDFEVFPNNARMLRDEDRKVIETEKSNYESSKVLVDIDGNERIFESNKSLIKNDNEKYILVIAKDVTRERKLQWVVAKEEAIKSDKNETIAGLTSGIAHEINTPAQYISANLNFLKENSQSLSSYINACRIYFKSIEDEKFEKMYEDLDLEYIIEEGELEKTISQSIDGIQIVSSIVQNFKNFAHPSSDIEEEIIINDVLDTSLTVTRNALKVHAKIKKIYEEQVHPISGCYNQLGQVFVNLINNGIHTIEDRKKENPTHQGLIEIITSSKPDYYRIDITDNGQGIKDEHKSKIFNEIFTTKKVGLGTGKGLGIVKTIIEEKHKGDISFESEYGVGTTLTIKLPYKN